MLVLLSRTDASHTLVFTRTHSMPFLHSLLIQVKLSISFPPVHSHTLSFTCSPSFIFLHLSGTNFRSHTAVYRVYGALCCSHGCVRVRVCVRMCVTAPIRATPAPHFFLFCIKQAPLCLLLKCSLHLVHSGG